MLGVLIGVGTMFKYSRRYGVDQNKTHNPKFEKDSIPQTFNLQSKIFNYNLPRQVDRDGAAGAVIVGCAHGSTHQPDEFSHQSKPDSCTAGGSGKGVLDPIKVVKYFFQILARDAGPGIGHHDLYAVLIPAGSDADLASGSALAEFHAVFNQID